MVPLFSIGSLLERYWGSKRVLNFYLMLVDLALVFFIWLIQACYGLWNEIGHFLPKLEEELDVVEKYCR
jgi:membrane associated rhomboid family serine protease